MAQTAPLVYPTPEAIEAYGAAVRGYRGGAQAVPVNTSNLGAPQVAGPAMPKQLNWRQRLGVRILGADGARVLFPPQQPLQPIAQPFDYAAVGRPWDYPVGFNTRVTPRMGLKIGFPLLFELGQYDLVRIMIERIKDDVVTQKWSIAPADKFTDRDARCDQLEDSFAYPDRVHTWEDWAKMLLDQMLVYDAAAVWLRRNAIGEPYSLEIMDGSKFTPKIMADGRLPPPEYGPAYQQVLHGLPAVDYIQPVPVGQPIPLDPDGQPFPEILYKPRIPRIDIPYGFSPVEQIITTILIGQSREEFFLNYYKFGSTPDLILSTPEAWNAKQVQDFWTLWNSMLQGNLQERRGAMMVPGGVKVLDTKEGALKDDADEWLVRLMCFCFGLSPMPFTKSMNRASGQTHQQQQKEEGTAVYLAWIAGWFNHYIRLKYGWKDIVFRWEEEDETEPLAEAQRFSLYLTNKVYHPDEIRAKLGDDAMEPEMRAQMDMPTFSVAMNATVLPPDQQSDADDRAAASASLGAPGQPTNQGAPGAPQGAGGAGAGMGKGRLAKLANRSVMSGRR